MSKIQVDSIVNNDDTGAPDCPRGLTVTGGRVGVGTNSPTTVTQFQVLGTSAGNTATFGGINQGTSGRVGGIILGTDTDNSSRRLWGIRGEASVAGQMGIFYSSDNITTPFSGTQTVSLTSGGNVKIENGNLVFSTSGTGIDFSATSDGSGTTNSEILDDYEEGTWTPVFNATGATFTTYTNVTRYTKIGNIVRLTGYSQIYCSAGGGANAVTVTGLPFTSANIGNMYQSQMLGGPNYFDATGYGLSGTIYPNSATVRLRKFTDVSGSKRNVDLNSEDMTNDSFSFNWTLV